MSLNWHIGNIKKYADGKHTEAWIEIEQFGQKGQILRPEIEGLIFWTCVVDLSAIKTSNINEFYGRTKVMENYYDKWYLTRWDEDTPQPTGVPMTMEVLQDHIGLSTNVTTRTRLQWAKRMTAMTDWIPEEAQGITARQLVAMVDEEINKL